MPFRDHAEIPHVRFVLASLAGSLSLGLLIFLVGLALFVGPWSDVSDNQQSDAPLKGAWYLMFTIAPTVAAASIGIFIAASYLRWRMSRLNVWSALQIAAVVSIAAAMAWLGPKGTPFAYVLLSGLVLTALVLVATFIWQAAYPDCNVDGDGPHVSASPDDIYWQKAATEPVAPATLYLYPELRRVAPAEQRHILGVAKGRVRQHWMTHTFRIFSLSLPLISLWIQRDGHTAVRPVHLYALLIILFAWPLHEVVRTRRELKFLRSRREDQGLIKEEHLRP